MQASVAVFLTCRRNLFEKRLQDLVLGKIGTRIRGRCLRTIQQWSSRRDDAYGSRCSNDVGRGIKHGVAMPASRFPHRTDGSAEGLMGSLRGARRKGQRRCGWGDGTGSFDGHELDLLRVAEEGG